MSEPAKAGELVPRGGAIRPSPRVFSGRFPDIFATRAAGRP